MNRGDGLPASSGGRRARLRDLWPVAGLIAVALVLGLGLSTETDVFFRVRVGQEIGRRGGLLSTNTFSFTYPDFPDLDTAWLSEVGMAAAHHLGGLKAVVVGKALLVAALAVLLWGGARLAASRGAAAIAVTLGLVLMRDRFVERPHMASLVCGAAWSLFLRWQGREREQEPKQKPEEDGQPQPDGSRRWPWGWRRRDLAAFLLLVVWANAHAGVFVAPFAAALLAAAAWSFRSAPGAARRLGGLAAFATVACFAQPHGWKILRYWWLHLTLPRLHTVDEFRWATWRSDAPLLAALVVSALASVWLVRRRSGWWPWLWPAWAMGALSVASVRFSADALIWWIPLWAAALDELVASAQPAVVGAQLSSALGHALPIAAPALMAGLAVSTLVSRARQGEPLLSPSVAVPIPADALEFVDRTLAAEGLRDRMYNDFETGSYLLYADFPRHRVFVDPRLPAYPAAFHALLGRFDHDRASWDKAMDDLGVQSALLVDAGLNRRVAWWEPEEWALVFRGHDARVFVRRSPASRALVARSEIPLTADFTVEEGAAPRLLTSKPKSSPVPDCEWQRRLGDLAFELDGSKLDHAWPFYQAALQAPGCLTATDEAPLVSWLGAELMLQRRAEDALPLLDRARTLLPGDVRVEANRAFALAATGQREAAREAWEAVAVASRGTPLEAKARAQAAALAPSPIP